MTWETVLLRDVISPVQGRAGNQTLPVYSVTKHSGFVPSSEYFKKQVYSTDLSTYKVVEEGQFAYATIHLDEGSIGVAPSRCVISPMYTVFSIDEARVSRDYFIRFLKSPVAMAAYPRLGRGTAERRKSISLEALGRLEVRLPPLPEQRRIAAILDEADALRRQASEATALAADLMRAKKDAPVGRAVPVGHCVTISSGKSIVGSEDSDSSARVLKISAVTSGIFLETESKPLPSGYEPPNAHLVHAGDLLVSRANTADLVGASAFVYDEPSRAVALPDKLWRLTVNRELADPVYLHSQISSAAFRAQVSRRATGSGGSMKNIGQSQFRSIPVCLPPIEWQRQFAIFASKIRAVQTRLTARAQELDALFASLQHRAFRGEL